MTAGCPCSELLESSEDDGIDESRFNIDLRNLVGLGGLEESVKYSTSTEKCAFLRGDKELDLSGGETEGLIEGEDDDPSALLVKREKSVTLSRNFADFSRVMLTSKFGIFLVRNYNGNGIGKVYVVKKLYTKFFICL